jgi:hypothetical protein
MKNTVKPVLNGTWALWKHLQPHCYGVSMTYSLSRCIKGNLREKNQFLAVTLQAVVSFKWSPYHRKDRNFRLKIKVAEGPYVILKYLQYCRWTRGSFCYSRSGGHPYPGFSGICIPLSLTYVRRYRHRIHRLCLFARNKNTKKVLLLATRLHESEN